MRYEPERSYHTVIGWKDPRTVPGELMWPERFGEREVKRLERKLGPYRAAGQLQQRPEPAGGGIIERQWFGLWESDAYPPMDYICAMLDTAYTEEDYNDPSAMIILGVFTPKQTRDNTGTTAAITMTRDAAGHLRFKRKPYSQVNHPHGVPHVMLMYAWREWLKLHDLVKKVAETAKRFRIDMLKIENKASGISVDQEIRRLYRNETFGVQLYDPKSQDKTARLISVQHLFAEGLVYAPETQWAEMVINEVCQYPKAKHKDLTDCVSMGMRHLRDVGLLARSTEIEDDEEALKVYPGGREASLYPV
jgi:predicted phage terminase large subunit-like protein